MSLAGANGITQRTLADRFDERRRTSRAARTGQVCFLSFSCSDHRFLGLWILGLSSLLSSLPASAVNRVIIETFHQSGPEAHAACGADFEGRYRGYDNVHSWCYSYGGPYYWAASCPGGVWGDGYITGDCTYTDFGIYYFSNGPCPPGQAFSGPAPGSCKATCPVPDLTELEKLNETLSNNDPDTMTLENNPINTSRWTDKTKLAYLCFVGKVNGAGVSVNLASAFRTDAYQRHLWEIYNRWKTLGLSTNTDETCTVLKKKVHDEWSEHGLLRARFTRTTDVTRV